MTRFFSGLLLGIVLLTAYWTWPFVGLHALAMDLAARDAGALNRDVDFSRLRDSLVAQIVPEYLRLTGHRLGQFGTAVVSALTASVADPVVAQIINAENLIALLNGGTVTTELGGVALNVGSLPVSSLSSAWRAWATTSYGLGQFSIGLPTDAAAPAQYRLRLQLLQWHWKLAGIDLPEPVREQLATELAKRFP